MTVLSSNESEQSKSAETIVGPGARLRKERESQGLDQVRVAAQLHLSETMIEALEWDDFDALPGAVFTQGYLRNYARLLGLPEAEIMTAYQQLNPSDGQDGLSAKRALKIKQELRSSHGLMQLVTWFIVIGLIALLYFWWQGRFGWQAVVEDDFTPATEGLQQQLNLDDPVVEMPVDSMLPEDYPTEVGPADAESLALDGIEEGMQADSEPQTDGLQTITENTTESQPETVAVDEILRPEVLSETPVQEAAEPLEQITPPEPVAAPVTQPEAPRQVIFEFNGRCWAEVRDATGKAHIIGEKRAGYRRVIESNLGPFKVILGDARAVSLTLDGEPYDLTPHTKGNVARFTLETE